MKIVLNGKEIEIADNSTVAQLLAINNIPTAGTAVACNDKVVKKSTHETTILCEGDRVEIIRAVAGG
ncbi:MAG: sulfur carrier protein ThiS [bacterium]